MLSKLEHVWNASKLYRDEINQMPAFCYGKVRAEAAVTCRTLTG